MPNMLRMVVLVLHKSMIPSRTLGNHLLQLPWDLVTDARPATEGEDPFPHCSLQIRLEPEKLRTRIERVHAHFRCSLRTGPPSQVPFLVLPRSKYRYHRPLLLKVRIYRAVETPRIPIVHDIRPRTRPTKPQEYLHHLYSLPAYSETLLSRPRLTVDNPMKFRLCGQVGILTCTPTMHAARLLRESATVVAGKIVTIVTRVPRRLLHVQTMTASPQDHCLQERGPLLHERIDATLPIHIAYRLPSKSNPA